MPRKIGSSLFEGTSYGGRVGLVACLTTGKQQVRNFCLSSCMLTNTNVLCLCK